MKKRFMISTFIASLALMTGVLSATSGKVQKTNDPASIDKVPNDGIDDIVDTFVPKYENIKMTSFKTPTDDKYSTQKSYSMNIVGDIESVWDTYTGEGVKIAVIDDGFDPTHQEYKRSDGSSSILGTSAYFKSTFYTDDTVIVSKTLYSSSSTCLDQEWDSANSEWDTHGTNTSTTAAAPMGNGGVVGIAPDADLLLIKTDMMLTSIEKAIMYAADQGCDIINMSLGAYAEAFTDGYGHEYIYEKPTAGETQVFESTATALEDACEYAHNKNSIIVAAAGNEATSVHSYPACNSYVIGVGALGQNLAGKLAKFSNHNKSETETGNKNVDILAPGYVYAAGKGGTKTSPTHTYNNTQGTSFSSPIVAGAAALWKQKNPSGTPDQFETQLLDSAAGIGTYKDVTISPVPGKNIDVNVSGGRLDIGALMSLKADVSGITISETSKNLYTSGSYSSNTSFEISANVTPNSAVNQNITWSTTNSNIAKLSKSSSVSGEIITVSAGTTAGTATIKATSQDGGFSATCTVTTTKYIPVTGFSLKDAQGNTSGTINKGETMQLLPTITPSNASYKYVVYIPEDETIAKVDDETGIITGLKAGTTDIWALCGNEELEDVYTITVEAATSGGTFIIDLYDSTTLNETGSQNGWSFNDLNGRVKLNGVVNNSVVTALDKNNAYKRIGGASLGSKSNSGNITFTISEDYKVIKATVVGTYWDSGTTGGIKLNNNVGTGKLNVSKTALADCKETIVWDNLNSLTSLAFTPTTNRNCIYTIECEYEGNGTTPVTPTPTEYTVTFNANGGSLGTNPLTKTVEEGTSITLPTLTRDNYTFLGWSTSQSSSTASYEGGASYTVNSNVTLYAIWSQNQSSGGDDSGDSKSHQYSFTNKSWAPWTKGKDGNSYSNNGVQITVGTSGANGTSIDSFKNVKKAIVTYCTNSSSGAGTVTVKIGNQTLGSFSPSTTGGTTARTSEITSTTALSGVANISVECSVNSIYICGIEIFEGTGGGDTPVTPTPTEYTVTFNANGGSLGTNPSTKTVEEGTSITLPTLTKEGYTFLGWSTSQSSSTASYEGGASYTVNSNVTLYAIWSQNQSTGGDVGTYYDGINETGGTKLLGALHDLSVTKHTYYNSYSGDNSEANYFKTDPYGTSSDYIRDFYTGGKMVNKCDSSGWDAWNREHLWCKSMSNGLWSSDSTPVGGGADIQHIRPTVCGINSARGNLYYGEVTNGTAVTFKDATGATLTGGYKNSTTFEPIDNKKGDVARILMYTYMHYNTYSNIGGKKDNTSHPTYFGTLNFSMVTNTSEEEAIEMLLDWNSSDPVDDIERIRNNEATNITSCRNPFIDHPEYADAIWGTSTPTPKPQVNTITIPETLGINMDTSSTATINAVVDADAGAEYSVEWISSDTTTATVSGNNSSATVTALKAGTVTITAKISDDIYDTCTVSITKSEDTPPTPPVGDGDVYELVTSSSQLENGAQYVIGGGTDGTVSFMSTSTNTNNRPSTTNTVASNQVTISDSTLILQLGVVEGGYTFKTQNYEGTDGYLASDSGTNNRCFVQNTAGIATISFNGGVSSVILGPSSTNKYLYCNNNGTPIFGCYVDKSSDSKYSNVYLYKQVTGGTPEPEKKITSIELECNVTTVIFGEGKGTYEAPAKLKAIYNDTSTGYITPDSKDYTVNTYVLGNHTISATYDGRTYEKTIKVTNEDSKYESSAMSDPINTSLSLNTSNKFTTSNLTVSGWTVNLGGTTNIEPSGSDSSGYNKFGSSKSKFDKLMFNFGSGDNVYTSVSIKLGRSDTACSGNLVAYTIDSDGKQVDLVLTSVKNNSGTSLDLNTSIPKVSGASGTYTYTFTPATGTTAKGTVYIGIDGSSGGKQLYVNNLGCTYKELSQPDNNFTLDQQAEAWAEYFRSLTRTESTCLASDDATKLAGLKDVWAELKTEYMAMVDGAKTAFTTEGDPAVIEHYRYIISKFGKDGLEDFIGVNRLANSKYYSLLPMSNIDSTTILLISFAILGTVSVGAYFVSRRRKEQ